MRYSRWIPGVMLSASLTAGCALLIGIPDEFPTGESSGTDGVVGDASGDGQDKCVEINGCRKVGMVSIVDLSSDANTGLPLSIEIQETAGTVDIVTPCAIVSSNDIIITVHSSTCSLRGGVTDGNMGTPDKETNNPIEQLILHDAGSQLNFKASGCVVPFYCDGDPSKRGAIFHKE